MADPRESTTGLARAVFSDAARACFLTTDTPIAAVDRTTMCELSYRFEAAAGGVLRIWGGPLGDNVLAVGCDTEDLNLVATLLLDGLALKPRRSPLPHDFA